MLGLEISQSYCGSWFIGGDFKEVFQAKDMFWGWDIKKQSKNPLEITQPM